jgi:hypothetical protein
LATLGALESTADTQPKLQPALLRLSAMISQYFRAMYPLCLIFGCAVMALEILTSCTAETTTAFRSSNQSTIALPTGVSEIRDRNNFRDEQQAAPRLNNAPIDP